MGIATEKDLPKLFETLDPQALRNFATAVNVRAHQSIGPRFVVWLCDELTQEVEHRGELKTRKPKLPNFAAWSDKEIAGALGVVMNMHTHAVSEIEEQFVRGLLHILSANAIIRLQFVRKRWQ